MISFGFAEISTPIPTTALNKIASSMSHSAQNGQQNIWIYPLWWNSEKLIKNNYRIYQNIVKLIGNIYINIYLYIYI